MDIRANLTTLTTSVMTGLKDFQRATVDRVIDLFDPKNTGVPTVRRVLVSDEVGLGKTLIARGVIARFAELRDRENDDLVKIVYVCSNGAIAEQNVNKLKLYRNQTSNDFGSVRLSMQHLNIFNAENDTTAQKSYIQLIPLTPDTSFTIKHGAGYGWERALMYEILRRMPELEDHTVGLGRIMRHGINSTVKVNDEKISWWTYACNEYYRPRVEKCNENSHGEYLRYMLNGLASKLNEPKRAYILPDLIKLCEQAEREGDGYSKHYSTHYIKELRIIFSELSVQRLDPDLVIMDEFQRFRSLIKSDKNSDTYKLIDMFFNGEHSPRVLLLSATPYKMYSTLDEIENDTEGTDHYREFTDVLEFLHKPENNYDKFETVWKTYSHALQQYAHGDSATLVVKSQAENALYSHICRTERIAVTNSADIIDDGTVKTPVHVDTDDIKSYISLQSLLNETVKCKLPVDYVKSAPYLLSFMTGYKLKKLLAEYFRDHPEEISALDKDTLFFDKTVADNYEKLPLCNARLRALIDKYAFDGNGELLLWAPPSAPYYSPQPPFDKAKNFSKTLVFSAWEMVPRMIASLVSYEAERRTIGALAKRQSKPTHYFIADEEKRRKIVSRLTFRIDANGEPLAMSLFCLLYPSEFLSRLFDPAECFNLKPTAAELHTRIKERARRALDALADKYCKSDNNDMRWYYLAPILADLEYASKFIPAIKNSNGEVTASEGFTAHIALLEKLIGAARSGTLALGKQPTDLPDIVAFTAIASPAVCAYRTYSRYSGTDFDVQNAVRACEFADVFIGRMNSPEWSAVIDLCCGDDVYWKNVLKYCRAGNFQATFDEYAHMLASGLNVERGDVVKIIHKDIIDGTFLHTTNYKADTLDSFADYALNGTDSALSFRSHYAVAFAKGTGTEKDDNRKKRLRNAFNSPFRPFVLASTSIGQEGLDFHNYCRRIVHWNLPSNPIDLEQREGRINRYKCLAIRQNVAMRYGDTQVNSDIWDDLFAAAYAAERTNETSDLVPFWELTEKPNMVKIERIVPMLPFSRDFYAYERLIKILNLYRLTLGQARQEELLDYLFSNRNGENLKDLFINLSPRFK